MILHLSGFLIICRRDTLKAWKIKKKTFLKYIISLKPNTTWAKEINKRTSVKWTQNIITGRKRKYFVNSIKLETYFFSLMKEFIKDQLNSWIFWIMIFSIPHKSSFLDQLEVKYFSHLLKYVSKVVYLHEPYSPE